METWSSLPNKQDSHFSNESQSNDPKLSLLCNSVMHLSLVWSTRQCHEYDDFKLSPFGLLLSLIFKIGLDISNLLIPLLNVPLA